MKRKKSISLTKNNLSVLDYNVKEDRFYNGCGSIGLELESK